MRENDLLEILATKRIRVLNVIIDKERARSLTFRYILYVGVEYKTPSYIADCNFIRTLLHNNIYAGPAPVDMNICSRKPSAAPLRKSLGYAGDTVLEPHYLPRPSQVPAIVSSGKQKQPASKRSPEPKEMMCVQLECGVIREGSK